MIFGLILGFTNMSCDKSPHHTKSCTLNNLIDDWNAGLEKTKTMVEEHNKDIEDRFKAGKLQAAAALAALEPMPKMVPHPSESWVRRWKVSWGWSMLSRGGDEQQSLPFDHIDMQQSREEVSLKNAYLFVVFYSFVLFPCFWSLGCLQLTWLLGVIRDSPFFCDSSQQ